MNTVFHQFELRFNPILDFPQRIKGLLAPYSRIFPKINIVKENSVNEQITFILDQEFYNLAIHWDRMVLQYEGNPSNLLSTNSLIEDPFIEIFKKIKNLNSFGSVTNTLFYTLSIKVDEQNEIKATVEDFKKNYLNSEIDDIVKEVNDVALVFESENEKYLKRIDLGPYKGAKDLINRKVSVTRSDNLKIIDFIGKMIEFKYVDKLVDDFNFSYYKKITHIFNEEINKYG